MSLWVSVAYKVNAHQCSGCGRYSPVVIGALGSILLRVRRDFVRSGCCGLHCLCHTNNCFKLSRSPGLVMGYGGEEGPLYKRGTWLCEGRSG